MTSSPRHTPGPWSRNIAPASRYPTVFAGRNTHVAIVTSRGLPESEIEANCDLIAAAPTMLATLKRIRDEWTALDEEAMRELAATAIVKAERL